LKGRKNEKQRAKILAMFFIDLEMVSIADGRTIYVDSYGAADFIIEGRSGHAITYIIYKGPTALRSHISCAIKY